MAWTVTEIVTVTSAISGGVSGILVFAATKGVDAYLRLRKGKMDENQASKKEQIDGYVVLITDLQNRLTAVEAKLDAQTIAHLAKMDALTIEHIECLRVQESLRGEVKVLQLQVKHAQEESKFNLDEINSLRQWRHDQADRLQTEVMKATVASVIQTTTTT